MLADARKSLTVLLALAVVGALSLAARGTPAASILRSIERADTAAAAANAVTVSPLPGTADVTAAAPARYGDAWTDNQFYLVRDEAAATHGTGPAVPWTTRL